MSDNKISPTQGADARPVAIYQKAVDTNLGIWKDITQGLYNGVGRDHRRIVYATRDATPADPNVIDYPEAYREMQAAYFAAVDEIRALQSQQDAAIESQRSGDGS